MGHTAVSTEQLDTAVRCLCQWVNDLEACDVVSRKVDGRTFGNIKTAAEHEHVRRDAQRFIDSLTGDLRRLARRLAASGGIELPIRAETTEFAVRVGDGEFLPVVVPWGDPAAEPAPDLSAVPMPLRDQSRIGDPDGLYGLTRDWARCSVTLTTIDRSWHQVQEQVTAVVGPTLPAEIVDRLKQFASPIEEVASQSLSLWLIADRARRQTNGNAVL